MEELGGKQAHDAEHGNPTVLELSLPKPVHVIVVREAAGIETNVAGQGAVETRGLLQEGDCLSRGDLHPRANALGDCVHRKCVTLSHLKSSVSTGHGTVKLRPINKRRVSVQATNPLCPQGMGRGSILPICMRTEDNWRSQYAAPPITATNVSYHVQWTWAGWTTAQRPKPPPRRPQQEQRGTCLRNKRVVRIGFVTGFDPRDQLAANCRNVVEKAHFARKGIMVTIFKSRRLL